MTDEELLRTPIRELDKSGIQAAIAAKDRKNCKIEEENSKYVKSAILPKVNVISDDLGTRGVLNPATGKMHDSKSQYYEDVRAAGCEIMGNDAKPEERKEIRGDYDCREALSNAIDQTNFMDKLKKERVFQ